MVAHTEKPQLDVDTVEELERWLESDPPTTGVRLRLRKKGTTRPGITYAEALDVALCHGWIDGQAGSIDADYYTVGFSPRRPRSPWSKINRDHVERLVAEGRMRAGGQAEVDRAKADGRWDAAYGQKDAQIPAELAAALAASPAAAAAFAASSAQIRWLMIYRIGALKREPSRLARAALYAGRLERGEPIT